MATQVTNSTEEHYLPEWMTLDKNSETKTPIATNISGQIPKWLSGNLYRNGAGIFSAGNQKLEHLFDGFAVIHRFAFHDGDVTYQSRILESDSWVRSCKANRLVTSQFVTYAYPDPCKSLLDRMMSYLLPFNFLEETDNTSVNIVEHGDKIYALTDSPVMNEVDPETLKRKSRKDLKQTVAVHMSTAHPHFDRDGTMYNLSTTFNPVAAYGIVAIPPKKPGQADEDVFKKASLVASLPSRFNLHISYGHSFGMTKNYFVILEQPFAVNFLSLLTVNWRRESVSKCFSKFPEEKMIFHVIRRSDNRRVPVTFQSDAAFCFHFVNCHERLVAWQGEEEEEEEEHLVVDLCCFDDVEVIEDLYLKNMANKNYRAKMPPATFRRFVLPLSGLQEADPEVNLVRMSEVKATARMVAPGVIHCDPDYITDDKIVMELPRINYEQCNGRKYRYAYGVSVFKDGKESGSQLVKADLEQREAVYWKETGFCPGEPVFVARPGATAEDDGVVLASVLSELPNSPSYLLVLDAHTFKELGRATVPCDAKVAFSFHGNFIPTKK